MSIFLSLHQNEKSPNFQLSTLHHLYSHWGTAAAAFVCFSTTATIRCSGRCTIIAPSSPPPPVSRASQYNNNNDDNIQQRGHNCTLTILHQTRHTHTHFGMLTHFPLFIGTHKEANDSKARNAANRVRNGVQVARLVSAAADAAGQEDWPRRKKARIW